MDLSYSPEELAFRDEVRGWLQANLPADLRDKVAAYAHLSRDDLLRWHRILAKKGSLFLTRPTLDDYVRERDALERAAGELFDLLSTGALRVRIDQEYPLRDAARAHADLQARKTTGSSLLLP